jgi:hypothetical protein
MVRLKSSNFKIFKVEKEVVLQLMKINNEMGDMDTNNPFPLPNVSSKILQNAIKYFKYCVDHPPHPMEITYDVEN